MLPKEERLPREDAQFWREDTHMRVETLIGGTMVEKSSLSLYGGDGSPFSLCLEFRIGFAKACIPGQFSKVVVPSGTRVFLVGNPYLFLKEG